MTPTRAAALEAVAIASRFFREAVSAPLCTMPEGYLQRTRATLDDAFTALDTLPAEPEPEGEMVEAKTVQIATCFDAGDGSYQPATVTTALRSDGSIWQQHHHEGTWYRLPDIPRPVVPVVQAEVMKP